VPTAVIRVTRKVFINLMRKFQSSGYPLHLPLIAMVYSLSCGEMYVVCPGLPSKKVMATPLAGMNKSRTMVSFMHVV